jgi:hypothetical protein
VRFPLRLSASAFNSLRISSFGFDSDFGDSEFGIGASDFGNSELGFLPRCN